MFKSRVRVLSVESNIYHERETNMPVSYVMVWHSND